jgi:hypothetical protein
LGVSKERKRRKPERIFTEVRSRGVQIPNLHGGWVYRTRITAFNRVQVARKNLFSSGSSAFARPDPLYFNPPLPRAIQKSMAKEINLLP